MSSHIVNSHVDLANTFKQPEDRAGEGTVYDYACEALSLGLLIMDFKDIIREGDGDRILSIWKYLWVDRSQLANHPGSTATRVHTTAGILFLVPSVS